MTATDENGVALGDAWAYAVGRFMIAFGSVESSVNCILEQWCSIKTAEFVRTSLRLEARMSLLLELATERDFGPGNREVLTANLGAVRRLAKTRNFIAHNPLMLMLFDRPPDDERAAFDHAIISEKKDDHRIKLGELQAAADEAKRGTTVLHQNQFEISWHGKIQIVFGHADRTPRVAKLERA